MLKDYTKENSVASHVYREIFDLQSVFFWFKFQTWNISFRFWHLKCKCNMEKKSMEFKIRESNLKMKSEQNPLSSFLLGTLWSEMSCIIFFFFNIVNSVLILLSTKISAEMLVLMSCGSFEMLCFSIVATTALLWWFSQRQNLDYIFTVLTGILTMTSISIRLVYFNTQRS